MHSLYTFLVAFSCVVIFCLLIDFPEVAVPLPSDEFEFYAQATLPPNFELEIFEI